MKHIVCYSGGHSSARVAIAVAERHGIDDMVLLNHDIHPSVEHADIKRFKLEVADYLGLPITYANHDNWDTMDPLDICIHIKAFKVGNGSALCSNRLKLQPFERWLAENILPNNGDVVYYGFDRNEKVRIQRRSSIMASMGYKTDYPLALWGEEIPTADAVGISPPMTYSVFKHANCIGCIKAKKQHWYAVFSMRPDIWEKGKLAEDTIGYTILNDLSLEEIEPLFQSMRTAGICPTEKVHPNTWWATVRKALRDIEQPELWLEDETDERPCECVF